MVPTSVQQQTGVSLAVFLLITLSSVMRLKKGEWLK
jgi:hypothetical protein